MSEPVLAVELTKDEFNELNIPGSFYLTEAPELSSHPTELTRYMWYRCPCGCATRGRLHVGLMEKPSVSPSWSYDATTVSLFPSVYDIRDKVDHWHGWLQDGYWKSV